MDQPQERPGVSYGDVPPTGPEALTAVLTAREIEVAQLVGAAKRNKEIARDLCLSQQTVERHLRNIFAKLAIRSRVELALLVTSPALQPEE
jgi:DNA-binding NarL/FixJ family response regulator